MKKHVSIGMRAMNYVTPLSNGTYLAFTVSNSVLSSILIATIIAAVVAVINFNGNYKLYNCTSSEAYFKCA